MPLQDISRIIGGFDPLSRFDRSRTQAEQRGARKFIANNPGLSLADKFERLVNAGLTPEANAIANLENSRTNAEFRDKVFETGERRDARDFEAGRQDAELRRMIARFNFDSAKAARTKSEEDAAKAKTGMATVIQMLQPDATPEQIQAIVDSNQGPAIIKSIRDAKAPLKPADAARIALQQADLDRKVQKDKVETESKERALKINAGQAIETAKTGARAITEALNILERDSLGTPVSGVLGKLAGAVPGSQRHALVGALNTIKGKVAFKALTDIKAAGGSLGALSDTELNLLQSSEGNLDPDLPDDVLKRNLEQILKIYQKIDPSIGVADSPSGEDDELNALLDKYS